MNTPILNKFWTLLYSILIIGLSTLAEKSHAETWDVELNKKQEKALAETARKPKFTAFAAAPGGVWGNAWNFNTQELADEKALNGCAPYLKKGRPKCVIVARNGKIVVGKTVQVTKVKAQYKPIDGKNAARFFGLVNTSFSGNEEKARQQHNPSQNDVNAWRNFPKDKKLSQTLTNKSLVNAKKKGWAIFLGKSGAVHYGHGNRGVFAAQYNEWAISPDGLLCMFFGTFPNGKQIDMKCMVIGNIKKGQIGYSWAESNSNAKPFKLRKGLLVAGNAGVAAVR
jgi:hypothetical protein